VLSQLDLVATQGTWGITDGFQLQAAATLPGFAFPAFGSLSQAGVQYGIDLPALEAGSWRVAILNTFLFHHRAQKDSSGHMALGETRGYLLPAAVLSLSLGTWDLSAMTGVWKGLQDDEFRITAGTSVLGTIASHWAVVGDWGSAWELRSEPEHWFSAAWALRYWNSWLTVDVGVQLAAMLGKYVSVAPNLWWEPSGNEYRSEWNTPVILPVLHLSFRP
jgi:hypothetical protein